MHCVVCRSVLMPTPSGAVCPDGHGGIVPLGVLLREMGTDLIGYSDAHQTRMVHGRLLIAALPVATLVHRQLGTYDVDGKEYRKAKHRQGALVAQYKGRRIWLWPCGQMQPVPSVVEDVQVDF